MRRPFISSGRWPLGPAWLGHGLAPQRSNCQEEASVAYVRLSQRKATPKSFPKRVAARAVYPANRSRSSGRTIKKWSCFPRLGQNGPPGDEPLSPSDVYYHSPLRTKLDRELTQHIDDIGSTPGIGSISVANREQHMRGVHPHQNHVTLVGPKLRSHMRIQNPAAHEIAAVIGSFRIDFAAFADCTVGAPDAGWFLQSLYPRYLAACGACAAGLPGCRRRRCHDHSNPHCGRGRWASVRDHY
jgi:hypothetical protein